MEKTKVTAIFDIGKTNKKLILFDEAFRMVLKEHHQFDEITDEDGFPAENLEKLTFWIQKMVSDLLKSEKFLVVCINFSTYGASLVHINKEGKPITILYNYLKPIADKITDNLVKPYGGRLKFSLQTASPLLNMLNSGIQLLWLKEVKPEVYQLIDKSLHLPQYLSFLFTQIKMSEFTSVGCHTCMWNYEDNAYHRWLSDTNIITLLPEVTASTTKTKVLIQEKSMDIGIGVHDSSASFYAYKRFLNQPFLLLSTGTWSIAINGFYQENLTSDALEKDCLNYMNPDGNPVRAVRLFLGKEFEVQVDLLSKHFGKAKNAYKLIQWDQIQRSYKLSEKLNFKLQYINPELYGIKNGEGIEDDDLLDFETAYGCLLHDLTRIQAHAVKLAVADTDIKTIFVDGGFSNNYLFLQMLANQLPAFTLSTIEIAEGTALGAALLMTNDDQVISKLKQHVTINTIKPIS